MELIFDDPDNPPTEEQIATFIARIKNQPEFSVDYSGSEILYKSILDELQLKKHDTFRLLALQSQCSSGIHYLESFLIDYQPKLTKIETKDIKKLIKKFKLLLDDIRNRIELYKIKDQHMEPYYGDKWKEVTNIYDEARNTKGLDRLKELEQMIRYFLTHFIDTTHEAEKVRDEARDVKKFISTKIDKLYEKLEEHNLNKLNTNVIDPGIEKVNIVDPQITTPDRILRELGVIEFIFKSQFYKFENTDLIPHIIDSEGMCGIDGRFINVFDIYSDVELLNLHLYKKEFTDRYENTNNHVLLQNQLEEIRVKATNVRDYYNEFLTNDKEIVKEYLENKSLLTFKESIELTENHSAVITINNYYINKIYLGCNRTNFKYSNHYPNYTFSYIGGNSLLAHFCQHLINFIDKLMPPTTKRTGEYSGPPIQNMADGSFAFKFKNNENIEKNSFENFIEEITSLEIRISAPDMVYSLDHYFQFASFYYPLFADEIEDVKEDENEKKDFEYFLQYDSSPIVEHAISYILTLTDDQIRKQVNRIKLIKQKLDEFISFYWSYNKLFHSEEIFEDTIFMSSLSKYFTLQFPDGKVVNKVSENFINNLFHAYGYKTELIDGFLEHINDMEKSSDQFHFKPIGLESKYSRSQLEEIYTRLQTKGIVISSDKNTFLNIFNNNFSGHVYWNIEVHGAQAALFDLIKRLTGKEVTASILKKYFKTGNKVIHDSWKIDKGSKFLDNFFSGL